ncbi:DUF4231 domain-containing protein [Dankookia rubra]|uniref:DUF4231 domain-containing protein n=1 Tax=Dankookia rubra TaxID=1442381 RepID=UPI00140D7C86|nr:DUF4231 domain-containing protein [Dankookia rubra]
MDAAADISADPARDPRVAVREARAEQYFKRDLEDQRRWYGERASRFKGRAQALGLAVVTAGAATAFLQVFRGAPWVAVLTALLGAAVAVAEGWRQIARYDEAWAAYRLASERMKRERRLYVNGAGEYRGLAEEEAAFLRFVEAVEAIVAEEQRIYWRGRNEGGAPAQRATPAADRGDVGVGVAGTGAAERAHGRP